MKYQNFTSTLDCPTIENQVVKDLMEILSPGKEVLDRMTDKPSPRDQILTTLFGYREYCNKMYQEEIARAIAEKVSAAATPVISQFIKNLLPGAKSAAAYMPTNFPVVGSL